MTPNPTANLERQFGLLEDLAIESYWNDDICRYISLGGESFAAGGMECAVAGQPDPSPMTAEAAGVIDRVAAAFRDANVEITYFSVELSSSVQVGAGSWFVEGCWVFTYHPGWTSLSGPPAVGPGAAQSLNDRWYLIDRCA